MWIFWEWVDDAGGASSDVQLSLFGLVIVQSVYHTIARPYFKVAIHASLFVGLRHEAHSLHKRNYVANEQKDCAVNIVNDFDRLVHSLNPKTSRISAPGPLLRISLAMKRTLWPLIRLLRETQRFA